MDLRDKANHSLSEEGFREAFSISFLYDGFFFFIIITFLDHFLPRNLERILRFFVKDTLSSMDGKEKKKGENRGRNVETSESRQWNETRR